MRRRGFLRGVAGGAAAWTIGGGLVGCAAGVQGLQPTSWHDPVSSSDERLAILADAILAPSPHNTQPWRLRKIEADALDLYVDPNRLLPHTDPPFRQIHIGQGTLLEVFTMAARERGFVADVQYFPAGQYANNTLETKPVARVTLRRDGRPARDPLYGQIALRTTNKSVYDQRAISQADLRRIAAAVLPGDASRVQLIRKPSQRRWIAQICREAMAIEVGSRKRNGETADWFRFSEEDINRRRDGLSMAQAGISPFKQWFAKSFLIDAEDLRDPKGNFTEAAVELTADQASSASAFLLLVTPTNSRLQQVITGRSYARMQLAATSLGIHMHPLSQVLQEYPAMHRLQRRFKDGLKINTGHTVQMLVRLGYAEPIPHAPRRLVRDMLLA